MLSLLFGIGVACYWGFLRMSVLSFQEQYQLFLTDTEYFQERMSVPGGLADYIGEFLTQFYFVPVLGACILALLSVALQVMVWLLARRNGANSAYYPLSFIPSLMLWAYMGDENVLLSFNVALLLALAIMLFYHQVSGNEGFPRYVLRKVAFILTVPLIYWLIGPCVLMVVAYVAFYELSKHRSWGSLAFGTIGVVYAVAVVLLCARSLQYPLFNLFVGINQACRLPLRPLPHCCRCCCPCCLPYKRRSEWRW